MKKIFFIFLNFLYFNLIFSESQSTIEQIIEWANKHNISISPKITLEFISTNNKHFKSKENINVNETLIEIPFDSILSPDKLYSLSSKKLKKIYDDMNTNETTKKVFRTQSTRDQTFLALCHYYSIFTKKSKKIIKEFGEYYETYEDNVDTFPLTYGEDEEDLISRTNFGFILNQAKMSVNAEIDYIQKHYNFSSFDEEEYLRYRVLSVAKSYNINNKSAIVPLADFFPLEMDERGNTKWFYNTTTKIFKIYSIKAITPGEMIYMKAINMPNSNYLLYYGKTFENNNYIDPVKVSIIHPRWQRQDNITVTLNQKDFDITDEGFIGNSIDSYRQLGMRQFRMTSNDDTGYKLMYKNLKFYLEDYEGIKEKDYYDKILLNENRINIKRIIDLEKLLINNRLRLLEEIIEDREKEKSKKADL